MKKLALTFISILFMAFPLVASSSHVMNVDFYEMFEEHGSIMLLIDAANGDILQANKSAAKFYGYSIEELEKMNIEDISVLSSDEMIKRLNETVQLEDKSIRLDQLISNGEIRNVDIYACIHNDEAKTIFATIYDITEKTKLEGDYNVISIITYSIILGTFIILIKNYRKLTKQKRSISNLNELRQTYIDADDSLIYLKDENLKYITVNKAVENCYCRKSADIIGHCVNEFTDRKFSVDSKNTDEEVLLKKERMITEVKWNNRILQKTKFPVKLMNGNIGVGAYIRDITEEHESRIEVEKAYSTLKENEEKLKLILDSTAEAVYGIDLNGMCTFCNNSCVKMLGYSCQEELLGESMHWKIHHSRRDGSCLPVEDCLIMIAINKGLGTHSKDEVFWRADNTYFDVEYYSYPQYRNRELVGAVITFFDITTTKRIENEIAYLNCHDSLTGLFNRRYFDEEIQKIDIEKNLPISILMGDVNGLKIINDIFGHAAGDLLLQNAAKAMRKSLRPHDFLVRLGGDEFVAVLPNTNLDTANRLAELLKNNFSQERVKSLNGSISFGCCTKEYVHENILGILGKADERMYEQKVKEKHDSGNTIFHALKEMYFSDPNEVEHAERVCSLCEEMGKAMALPEADIHVLIESSLLHDIGFISQENRLHMKDGMPEEELSEIKQHPVLGSKILSSFADTAYMAKFVLYHHECWNGTGYPTGIRGSEIPLLSRIMAVAEMYQETIRDSSTNENAMQIIMASSGICLDPEVVMAFVSCLQKGTQPYLVL